MPTGKFMNFITNNPQILQGAKIALGMDDSNNVQMQEKRKKEEPPVEEPKKDNSMLIYLGLGVVVLFMLMKKK